MLTRQCFAFWFLLAATACSTPATQSGSDASDVVTTDDSPADATPADDVGPVDDVAPADEGVDAGSSGDGGLVSERPYSTRIPRNYNAANPTPLVILLHGYGASGATQDLYFRLSTLAEQRTFLYAYPDGTLDSMAKRFWNASDACCDFDHRAPDDVAYVNAIIDDMSAHYNVDPHRIFLVGHSNGAFMSHRFACDMSDRVAAIVTLAGVPWNDMTRCAPGHHVSVLQVHGTADAVILYNGGTIGTAAYPSARASVDGWAMRNGCTGTLAQTGMTLDLDTGLPGAETTVASYGGCPADGASDFWTITGGSHIPSFGTTWAPTIYDWLSAHPRP